MKRKLFAVLASTMLLSVTACSQQGVSQEEYDSVLQQLEECKKENEEIASQLSNYKKENEQLKELNAVISEKLEEFSDVEVSSSDPVETTVPAAESVSVDDIKFKVKSLVRDSVSKGNVSISSISINENLGTDEAGDYIALINLSFDAKNKADTTKKMLDLLNNEIGANMSEIDCISEFTIFWAVPYLSSSDNNVAKANLLRNDRGFYFADEWFDASIFQ